MKDLKKLQCGVIVTGAAQGIGRAIAEAFVACSARVVVADIDAEAGLECEKKYGGKSFKFVECDVRREDDVKSAVAEAGKFLGGIDVLVNNAGGGGFGKPLQQLSLQEWNSVINLNLGACFLFSKYCIPLFTEKASIINISSTRAFQSEKNTEAYSAAKGGIVAFTHALAVSLGPRIRVNCISPGWIRTDGWRKKSDKKRMRFSEEDDSQHPVGRIGVPQDVARTVLFLASERAGFITGQNFVIDGGMTKKMIYV